MSADDNNDLNNIGVVIVRRGVAQLIEIAQSRPRAEWNYRKIVTNVFV